MLSGTHPRRALLAFCAPACSRIASRYCKQRVRTVWMLRSLRATVATCGHRPSLKDLPNNADVLELISLPWCSTGQPAPSMPSSQRRALVLQVVHTRQVVSQAAKRETVIPDPSYHLPAALAGISGLGVVSGNATLAGISGILAAFLAIQASRVKFIFGPESLVRSTCWHIHMRCIHRSCHIHRTCMH